MSGSNSAERKRHEPLVLVETADLSEEDWLDYRRRGIGGSDVSAIFGTSPFRTARDLYYDKLNIASVEDDEGIWVAYQYDSGIYLHAFKKFLSKPHIHHGKLIHND